MASLNTLRTKFGVILSVVIGIALLAFILSLGTEMGFTNQDPKVGEMDGEKITYTEYYSVYENTRNMMGGDLTTDAQLDQLSSVAWNQMLNQKVLLPGYEAMGLTVSDAERKGIINGTIESNVMLNAFGNPATGTIDTNAVADFLAQAEGNPQAVAMWQQLISQAVQERLAMKYGNLVKMGANVTTFETERSLEGVNKSFAGKYVSKSYSSVADSLVVVTDADIQKYYSENKAQYKQLPNRTIRYVVFDVDATPEDMTAIEQEVNKINETFSTLSVDELRSYARENRRAELANRYLAVSQYSDEEGAALSKGEQYGPVLKNNVWTISRAVDSRMAPDSIGVRHIVVPFSENNVADSLATELRNGVDFAQVSEGRGEERVYPYSAFTEEFLPAINSAKVGDVLQIPVGGAIHIMQVYKVGKPIKHIRSIAVNYPVEASTETKRDVYGQAGIFAVDGAGSVEKFNEAATAASLTPRSATLQTAQSTVRGLDNSRELVSWANRAKVGDISQIFNCGTDYVVAMLVEIDNDEYASLKKNEARIRRAVTDQKKADYILNGYNATTIDEAATFFVGEVADFENVNYASRFVPGLGMEHKLFGAISQSEVGKLSAPVKGNSGVYVYVVDTITDAEAPRTLEEQKTAAQASAEIMAQNSIVGAVMQMAEVEDLRGKYF